MNILDLSEEEAKKYFLEPTNFCKLDLPKYIDFKDLLINLAKEIKDKLYNSIQKKSPKDLERVNYFLFHNKDGKYDWRPFQIINPILYISLVNVICKKENWEEILKRFKEIDNDSLIQCESLPIIETKEESSRLEKQKTQILNWWKKIEQISIQSSLDYNYIFNTDIVDCYSSMYTHSISWALHTKFKAKNERNNKSLLGNIIDSHLQAMSYGQTNGIPQGSVLMDFIAEIVLKYVDELISKEIKKEISEKIFILRYRDDYRIFTKELRDGEKVMKIISKVLSDVGLKLNSNKTNYSDNIIMSSLKSDKLEYLKIKKGNTLEKRLILIFNFSLKFPNSGSVQKELSEIRKKLEKKKSFKRENLETLISIITEIIYRNPRVYIEGCTILNYLFIHLETTRKEYIIEKVFKKLKKVLNSGYFEIWFQRAILKEKISEIKFDENICKLVIGEDVKLWNIDWIESKKIKKIFEKSKIVNNIEKERIPEKIEKNEIEIFDRY